MDGQTSTKDIQTTSDESTDTGSVEEAVASGSTSNLDDSLNKNGDTNNLATDAEKPDEPNASTSSASRPTTTELKNKSPDSSPSSASTVPLMKTRSGTTTGPVKSLSLARRSNPSDLLKNLKSVDKKNQKKPTILELAAQDWNKCKAEEKIEEELKQATKSKGGYLERQRFLERSDLRQFEREREIRDRVRSRASLSKDN